VWGGRRGHNMMARSWPTDTSLLTREGGGQEEEGETPELLVKQDRKRKRENAKTRSSIQTRRQGKGKSKRFWKGRGNLGG